MSSFLRDVAPFTDSMEPGDVVLAAKFFAQSISSKGESSVLEKLKMTSCNFSEDFWTELFDLLRICKKLTHLILSRNSLGKAGYTLASSIQDWGDDPPLKVLKMDQCLMPEDVWVSLFLSLHTCKHITHLDLSYNRLRKAGEYLALVISIWEDKSPLQKLDLSYCSMSAEACDRIFRRLTRCKRLTYLDLSGNMVGEAGLQLARAIRSWGEDPPLRTFIVQHCFIPSTVWRDLLTSLSACNKLIYLDLSHNNLNGCLSSFLHSLSSRLHSLNEVLLDSCSLNEDDLQHLVKCVESEAFPSLQNLYLHDNRLRRMEDTLGELIQSCIDSYKEKEVKLWVQGNFLSEDYRNFWISRCENTNVSLDLQIPGSSEKSFPTKVN